jgi:hypothetical protein
MATAGLGSNGNSIDKAAIIVGGNVSEAEAELMEAYSLREGAEAAKLIEIGNKLGIKKMGKDDKGNDVQLPPDLKGLQLIAEQRYQHSNRIYTMFSSLLDKMDQMKQRLIQKFGQG